MENLKKPQNVSKLEAGRLPGTIQYCNRNHAWDSWYTIITNHIHTHNHSDSLVIKHDWALSVCVT